MAVVRMKAFDSSTLKQAHFFDDHDDGGAMYCDVTFLSGATVYRYFDISQGMFEAWENAVSSGKFFHSQIRSKYSSLKLVCFNCKIDLDPATVSPDIRTPERLFCPACSSNQKG